MNKDQLIEKYEKKGEEALKKKDLRYYQACKDFLYDLRYKFHALD